MSIPFLEVAGINFRENNQQVLKEISFTQQLFQKIALSGETGSGKSSLLQIIAGLIQPVSGGAFFQGRKIIGPQDQLIPGHPGIAYLSQQYELPAFLRVEQVLTYANKLPLKAALHVYKVCRIEHLLPRQTSQLSGGERQRIALARLLLGAPKLLLLDEPFSNLDMGHKNVLKAVIQDLGEKMGITLMLISHDPLDTLSWADRILVMRKGKIIQKGTPSKIYNMPVNAYVAGLFGNYSVLPTQLVRELVEFPPEKVKKQHLLFRPEQLTLRRNGPENLAGLVQQIRYFGSYFETEISLQGNLVKIKMDKPEFQIGELVYLALSPETNGFTSFISPE